MRNRRRARYRVGLVTVTLSSSRYSVFVVSNPITDRDPSDEDELQQILAEIFRSEGWTAIREYTPDRSQKRVDLFVEHERYGEMGIETKHLRSDRNGAKLAEAYVQITRDYWRKQYNGEKVLLWAIAPYF